MPNKEGKLAVRSKVWIVDDKGEVVFGRGRKKILEAVMRCGSIHAAAKDLKMSYRAVWGRIKATEERLGKPLLVRNIGGAAGGGSQLTEFALNMMRRFQALHQEVAQEVDRRFDQKFRAVEKNTHRVQGCRQAGQTAHRKRR